MNTEVYPTENGGHTYVALLIEDKTIKPFPVENWKLVKKELRRGIISEAISQGYMFDENDLSQLQPCKVIEVFRRKPSKIIKHRIKHVSSSLQSIARWFLQIG